MRLAQFFKENISEAVKRPKEKFIVYFDKNNAVAYANGWEPYGMSNSYKAIEQAKETAAEIDETVYVYELECIITKKFSGDKIRLHKAPCLIFSPEGFEEANNMKEALEFANEYVEEGEKEIPIYSLIYTQTT